MGAAARDALERDENSLEGAFGPRSRRGPARGGRPAPERGGVPLGGRPTLERDRTSLERGGFVPGRRRTPRAERSSARGWLGRLFDGPWARGFVLCACLGSFAFIFYEFYRVSPGCLGDPHSCPRHIGQVQFIPLFVPASYFSFVMLCIVCGCIHGTYNAYKDMLNHFG
jgi:hypothetical protein